MGESRVPVRLVNGDGKLYLCGEDNEKNCGPRIAGWNTIPLETGDYTTSAALNGVEAKQAKHQPKRTWISLGQGYRKGN